MRRILIVVLVGSARFGAFRAEKDGVQGSRPTYVVADHDEVEIVLEDRIPLRVAMNADIRLPANRRLHGKACPINPDAVPRKDLGPNTQVNECPPEHAWTGFIANGEWIDDRGMATIRLPWPGHYAFVLEVGEAGNESFWARVSAEWVKFVLKDEPTPRLDISVTQDQVDRALKELEKLLER